MQFVADNFTWLLFGLVVMWLFQFGLAYLQMRRFYGRLVILRRNGLTAVGMCGNQYKGRAYAVLTINDHNQVINAEKFAGWTVFANLKPVPALVGLPLDEILDGDTNLPVSKKLRTAFVNAAKDLKAAREKESSEKQPTKTFQFA